MKNPSGWRLDDAQLTAWVDDLTAAGLRVLAPVEEDGLRLLRPIASIDEADFGSGTTRWSPKELLLPRTESLYSWVLDGNAIRLQDPPGEDRQQVLFGVRCCDAAGLARLDRVFFDAARDPFYARRRELTTIVALACTEAVPQCFCTAVGVSPGATEGSDLMLIRDAGSWLLRTLTHAGEALVEGRVKQWRPASDGDWQAADELRRAVECAIGLEPLPPDCGELLQQRFEHEAWHFLGERCFGCRLCAAVCPSCSCFDMSHEGGAWGGTQSRTWDSCALALFTHHASGHNPRAGQYQRFRQRVLHKFAFSGADEVEGFRCVGCGRCVALCPGGLDIRAAVEHMIGMAARAGDDD